MGKTVLHVIDTTGPGGAETVFIELADQLRLRGHRSVVLVRGPGWVHDQLVARRFSPYVVDAKGSFNWRFVRALVGIIRREKVDVIQSHLLGSNVYCAIAGLIARRPVVATFHGMVDVGPGERFRGAKLWFMNRGAQYFVTVSKSLRDVIHREGLLNLAKAEVIYNGIRTDRYGKSDVRELRERLLLPNDAILIGSLGNIRPAKGYDLLISAARQVIDQYPQAHFVIAGDPKVSLQQKLSALAVELGIAAHIHFIGFCNDSARYLGQLDLFVLSSTSEGLSIATIEALATGLPAVATKCGGPEEILVDRRDGLLVEPQAEALAQGVLQQLRNPQQASCMGAAARQSMRERFDIGVMLSAYETLYEKARV